MFILGSKDGALRAALWCLVCEKGRVSAIGELAILDLYPVIISSADAGQSRAQWDLRKTPLEQ